jgi:protein translocase SecG subunit
MILTIIQVTTAIALIVLILLQERGGGTSALFGGTEGGLYHARRGLEKTLFTTTISLVIIFALVSILNLLF